MLRCYCDESYDKDSRIYSVAGFLARDKEWKRVSREWKNRCLKSRVDVYHATDIEGRFGDYAHLSNQDVIELNTDLVTLISSSNLDGWGSSIILEDFRAVSESGEKAKRVLGPSPYFLAMQLFLVTLACKMYDDNPNYRMAFVFDQQHEFSGRAKKLYAEVKAKNPTAATCMGSLSYADKKKATPLQLADKLTYEVMKYILNLRYDPTRKERIALTRMKEGHVIDSLNYLDRATLTKIVNGQSGSGTSNVFDWKGNSR
jgi:hypothetical protein